MTSYIGEAAVVMTMNVIVMGAIGIAAPTMTSGIIAGVATAIDVLMTIAITDQAGAIAAQTMTALYVIGEFEIASRT